MRTARLLPVSPSMHCSGGMYLPGEVYLPRGWWGVPAQEVYLPGGCTPAQGVYLPGVYLPGGCTCPGWCNCPGTPPPWTDRHV